MAAAVTSNGNEDLGRCRYNSAAILLNQPELAVNETLPPQ